VIKLLKNPKISLFLIGLLTILLFFRSLTSFYTHDDFFLLKISNAKSFSDFIGFFNLIQSPEGLGMYRPLAMQSFYLLARLFDLNPLPLHIISFLTLFGIIYLVYLITTKLTNNVPLSLFTAFLYAVSSSHFSHLYFLGVYQELAVALFILLSVYFFAKYLDGGLKEYVLSFLFFILALLSKETAVITPVLFVLVCLYRKVLGSKQNWDKLPKAVLPMIFLLGGYLYLRFNYYGFPQGDSYVIDISPRILNTLFWYGMWSFNMPEMLVDFIGPGFDINIAPLLTWKTYILISLISFVLIVILAGISKLIILKRDKKLIQHVLFGILWFVITLTPVVIYPWHKFSYYLTLPLFGVVFVLASVCILSKNKIITSLVVFFWIIGSVSNLILLQKTHWIIRGSQISENVYQYFSELDIKGKRIVFYDTLEDANSPWIPSQTIKDTLSDDDFFLVFFPEVKSVDYQIGADNLEDFDIKIRAVDMINI
jgi:hypothetical protein